MSEHFSATGMHRRPLVIVFTMTIAYFAVEVIGGIMTNSLALLADAAHMLTDAGALGLALFAAWISRKPATAEKTYGYYRAEILAALANGIVLVVMSIFILVEAYNRFRSPAAVAGLPMALIAAAGLIVNLIGISVLRKGSKDSLNVQGAFLEVISDALGSIGVIVAGIIMLTTGWYYADPLFSVLIGLFILPRTWKLLRQTIDILLEGTPSHIDVSTVRTAMQAVPDVVEIHDLHIWTITSGMTALSAHVVMRDGTDFQHSLQAITKTLNEAVGICHLTIQLETARCGAPSMQH